MAANSKSTQSVLDKIGQDHLECSICSSRFQDPRVLDCLHSFCFECLQKLRECQEQDSIVISCPLCRCPTKLEVHVKDIFDLPKNFTLTALVDEFAIQEELHTHQGSEIMCQNCEEQNVADSRCVECDSFLCQKCLRAHRRMAFLKSHKVHTLIQSESSLYKSRVREDAKKCGKHPDQTVNAFCDTCKKLACTTCSLLNHSQHILQSLSDASEKCKQEIKELITEATKRKAEYNEVIEEVDKTRQDLDEKYANINSEISEKAAKEIDKIKEEEKKLQEEAKKVYDEKVQMLEKTQMTNRQNLAENEQMLEEVERLMDLASCHEILDFSQKMKQNLMDLMKKHPGKVSGASAFMVLEPGEQSLGRLVLEEAAKPQVQTEMGGPPKQPEKWQLKTKLKGYGPAANKLEFACHAAVFSNNKIIVVDTKISKLISYTPKTPESSAISNKLGMIKNLFNPRRVAVNKDDHLIVLAGRTIRVVDSDYNPLHQFKPCTYVMPKAFPTCLAVDDENLIAVGNSKGLISLHQPSGFLVKKLSAPGVGDYLAICNKRLIYTDCDNKQVLAVDYDGRNILRVNFCKTNCILLQGLCCGIDGSIYVAAPKQDESDEIHQFSPTGGYLGRVIKGCDSVRGIALSPNGDLVVAAEKSIQVYSRV